MDNSWGLYQESHRWGKKHKKPCHLVCHASQALVDPVDCCIASIIPLNVSPVGDKSVTVQLSDDTLKGIKAIQKNCGKLNPTVQGSLSHWNFDRSAGGSKAIVQWLEFLPQMYVEKGLGFLDSAGCVKAWQPGGEWKVSKR